MAYEPADRDLSGLTFTHPDVEAIQPQTVLDSAIQIITPDGQAVFTWNSWGIMPLEDCTQHRFVKFRGDPGGYAHINSLQMVDGLIIASFRGCSKVLAIDPDHADGHKVAWRVGRSNLTAAEWEARDVGPAPLAVVGDPAGEFCAQHAAQILPSGNLLLFDNGVHCVVNPWTGEFVGRTDENYYSRGVEYALDHANGEAVFVRDHSLHDAQQYLGNAHGQIEPLANGDWLISWGRARGSAPAEEIPDEAVTQVDPDTGEEKFSFRVPNPAAMHYRAIPLHPVALFRDPGPLAAALPPSSATSVFHTGTTDAPKVVVAFSRPVVDFDADTASVSVQGATVASVSPHLTAGEPANAYLFTLTPDGEGAITFSLVANQACDSDGVCTADGTMLTSVPAALVIGAPVTVEFAQSSYTVVEGGTIDVTVSLSAAQQGVREVAVPLTVTESAAMTHGYSVSAESVPFAAGERTKTVAVSVQPDLEDNDDEYVTLGFGVLPVGVNAGTTSQTQVDITDDDYPDVVVRFDSNSYTVGEGDSVEITLTLSANPERTVIIPITATHEAGASSADYGGLPSAVTFNSGETTKDFTLTATQDNVDDDDEGLRLGFGVLPTRVSAGSPDESTVSITDDDVPTVTVRFEQSAYTVAEGTLENIRVTLSSVPERTVDIPLTVVERDGATSADYSGVPGSVTFRSGETEQTVPFFASDDGEDDDGESVRISFGTLPERVTGGGVTLTDISITDDDLPAVSVRFGAASYELAEGGDVAITLTLSAEPERTVTIPITAVLRGGASDADYALTTSALTFSSTQTERTFTMYATHDREDDNGESVLLSLGALPTGVSQGSTSQTSVAIIDDDVTVSFQAADYTVAEGAGVAVEVTLSEDPGRTVVIPITAVPQNGAVGSDYSGVPARLTYQSGETVQSFTLAATDDTVDDDGESVDLGFGTLPDTVTAVGQVTASVSILDNDFPEVSIGFEQSSYAVAEGRSVTVRVLLSAEPERPVTVQLTALEQAGATSADYSGAPASVAFTPEETEQTFTFNASADDTFDAGESVLFGFAALPERVQGGTVAETVVLISDDDLPQVNVSFDARLYTVTEGSRVTIGLKLSADPQRTVTIPITLTNQGGATDSDHSGASARVTFEADETTKNLTFLARRDSDDDGGEWVVLGFGALPEGVSVGAIDTSTVTIRDGASPSGGSTGGGGGTPTPTATAPDAPAISAVTAGEGSLAVTWTSPLDDGGANITTYDLRYIRSDAADKSDDNWHVKNEVWTNSGTLEYTITGLPDDTEYDVQLRARNSVGNGDWSATATGTTIGPEPTPADSCVQGLGNLTGTVTQRGSWASDCASGNRSGSYARFYTFTLSEETEVTINLTSEEDPYLFLQEGAGRDGAEVDSNDDIESGNTDSQIVATLTAGTYTVEATTYNQATTGSFTLTVTPAGGADSSTGSADQCVEDLGTLLAAVSRNGSWTSDCPSENQAGSYAQFYSFTLAQETQLTIDLTSQEDTYLFLLRGSGRDGAEVDSNDDIESGNTNSQIVATLAAGAYTIEATTYNQATTGSFSLSVTLSGDGDDDGDGETPPTTSCSPVTITLPASGLPGSWADDCQSQVAGRGYARFFSFTLAQETQVTIDLSSTEDSFLFLREGSATSGAALHQNDDIETGNTNSQIVATLAGGTYTIEATTYNASTTGNFSLSVTPAGDSGSPSDPTDQCVEDLGTLSAAVSRNGSWTSDCSSQSRDGTYAQFYSFTLAQESQLTIDLTSEEDTYLFLLRGSGRDGAEVDSNDDVESGNTNSKIVATLAAGAYTIEATTYNQATTGSFTLTVSSSGDGDGDGDGETPPTTSCSPVTITLPASGLPGSWADDCQSQVAGRGYARFFSFTLAQEQDVTINLSSSVDTYLYLREGNATSGTALHQNDDIESGNTNSKIVATLAAGAYTIEATTYNQATTGSFTLTVTPAGDSGSPSDPTGQCVEDLGTLSAAVSRNGSWTSDCSSQSRDGTYAQFYSFTMAQETQVTIDLSSTEDTYLFLRPGSATSGTALHENDDIETGNTNSQIVATLAGGTYTIEATTYNQATTGNFSLSVTPSGDGGDDGTNTDPDSGSDSGAGSREDNSCGATVTVDESISANWASDCTSGQRAGSYAQYYTFTLDQEAELTIDLASTVDTYLYLREGSATSGTALHENDDIDSGNTDSQIVATLAAGAYTVEATTYDPAETGNYTLSVSKATSGEM